MKNKYDKRLPPEWYTKIERFILFNWRLIFFVAVLLFFFVFPFVYEDGPYYPPYGDRAYDPTSR